MGVYYMQHPKHGTKVATDEIEVKADEKEGWQRYEIACVPEASAEIVQLREQYEAKFGKKPHHKKTAESLKADLTA